jgi:hypothetical protein
MILSQFFVQRPTLKNSESRKKMIPFRGTGSYWAFSKLGTLGINLFCIKLVFGIWYFRRKHGSFVGFWAFFRLLKEICEINYFFG